MSRRPFAALAVAETLSITGSRLTQLAIPWIVLTTTKSATWTGVAGFAVMLPYVVMKALGGPLTDRLGAKQVAVAADLLSVATTGAVPVLHLLGLLHLAVLLPISAVMGALRGPADGAKAALIPAVAAYGDLPLERVTGVLGTIDRLGSTVGAALAGGLIALIGAPQSLAFDAAGLLVAVLLIAVFVPPSGHAEPDGTTYRTQLRAGWDFLRRDDVLVGISAMVALTNLLDQGYSAVLVPVWAVAHGYSAGTVGLVFAVFSGAAIGGSMCASAWGARIPRLPVYAVSFVLAGLPKFAVLGAGCAPAVVVAVMVLGGFAAGFINPILSAVILERIPDHLVGRVSSLNNALCWSLIPFGGLVAGWLIALVGLTGALWAAGLAYFGCTLMPLLRKSFRDFGSRPKVVSA